ncbi:MAG TPA: plastocyanin/azurin family copper-binding protein [Ktedonobacterales bacterium]|nr:plastocyanin/azurin family copper-binding protein [Ktedonobacterales bacterium]
MRKLAALFLLCLTFTLAACGSTTTGNTGGGASATATAAPTDTPAPTATTATTGPSAATISFGRVSFSGNTDVTIKAGQAVLFDDPESSGGTHILVIGHNGQFTAMSGAPSEFNSADGTAFSPGDQKTITFAHAGTFPITCTIHPSMQVTVTVK